MVVSWLERELHSSVGIVPGRMENREDTIKKLAEYLGIGADEIEDKLKADWVKADSFVPVATIPKKTRGRSSDSESG